MPIADLDYSEYFTAEAIVKLEDHFKRADVDGDGNINEAELTLMMKRQGRNISSKQLREMIKTVDYNASGSIEFEELAVLEIMLNDLKPHPTLIDYRDFLPDAVLKCLENQFVQHDLPESGTVDLEAVGSIVEKMGVKVKQELLHALFKKVDQSGEGHIEFSQLGNLYAVASRTRKKCNYREFMTRDQVASFRKVFMGADHGTGHVGFPEVEAILRRLGLQVKKSQMEYLMQNFDVDGSGDIDFEEFSVMMLRLKGMRRMQVINPTTCNCEQLWFEENFTVPELQQSGFGLRHFREANIPVGKLIDDGKFSALELRRAGFSPGELRRGGLGAEDLQRCGFSLVDLRNAGFSDSILHHANHNLKGCFSAGDLSPLPQRRPVSKEGKGPVRGAVLSSAGARHLAPPLACQWQLPPRPMTQMIREHTDWKPMLSQHGSKANFSPLFALDSLPARPS